MTYTPASTFNPGDSDFAENLNADLVALGDYTDLARRPPIGTTLMQAMENDDRDVGILVVGDSTCAYSTSADLNKWPYVVATALGARYPKYTVKNASWTGSFFQTQTDLQTGTGTHKLWILNAGWGGKGPRFQQTSGAQGAISWQARNKIATGAQTPIDLIFIAHGHNDGSGISAQYFRDDLLALCEVFNQQNPTAEMVVVSQNPRLPFPASDYQQALVHEAIRICRMRGYGHVNAWKAIVDASPGGVPVADPAAGALVQSDNIHPNTAGYVVWGNEVLSRMFLAHGFAGSQRESSLSVLVANMLANGDFASFASPPTLPSWTATNVTASKDTTNIEGPNAYALQLASATAAAAYMSQSLPVVQMARGRLLTVAARLFVTSATKTASPNAGRISIVETGGSSAGETISNPSADGVDNYLWISTGRFISMDATGVAVRLYANTGANSSTVTYERAILARGALPRDLR